MYIVKALFCCSILISFFANEVRSLSTESIRGGEYAPERSAGYHAYFLVGAKSCNGALVDDLYVITAASCVADLRGRIYKVPIKVKIGKYCLEEDNPQGTEAEVGTIYIPARYQPAKNQYADVTNLAVLKLKNPVIVTDLNQVTKVMLPYNASISYEGSRAFFSGFGKSDVTRQQYTFNVDIDRTVDGILRYGMAKILPPRTCRDELRMANLWNPDGLLCGRFNQYGLRRGACKGDIGGPLVCGNVLIGILAFETNNCDESKASSFYTRISCNMEFINAAMSGADNQIFKKWP